MSKRITDTKADKKTPKNAIRDDGETVSMMEPLLISASSRHREQLADLAVALAARSAGFRRSLPEGVLSALAELVRAMNCYYSNLIEGHDTHPIDIERALNNDYSTDPEKRNLQLEAKAHIAVQRWIDQGELNGRAVTSEGIQEIHRRFGELLPGGVPRYVVSLTTAEGIFGLSGLTVTFCILELTTRSISSIGMAPNKTLSPEMSAPVKQVLFSNFT